MDLCSFWLFVVFTFRCCQSWRNVVDDRIEGRSLGEAEVWGSWSCGAFVRRNNESEGYDDPGGHRFVVHGLYRRCTVLKTSRGARCAHVFARTAAATDRSGESSGCGPVQRGPPIWQACGSMEGDVRNGGRQPGSRARADFARCMCLQLSVHRLNARRSRPSVAHAANEVSAHAQEQTQLVSVSGAERTVRRSQLGRQFRF